MERVSVRPVGRSIRGVAPGGTVGVSKRDARLLVRIGRAEYVDGTPEPEESKRRTPVKKAAKKTAKKAAKKGTKQGDYKRRDMKAEE